jgi:TIGR03009 family protein
MRESRMYQRLMVGVLAFALGLVSLTTVWGQAPSDTGARNRVPLGPSGTPGRDAERPANPASASRDEARTPLEGTDRERPLGAATGKARGNSHANSAGRSGDERLISGPPSWWPLREDHEKYLDEILGYWEYNTGQITRYECKFTRWIYDPAAVRADAQTGELPAREISQGVIKYMTPASAMYKVEKVYGYRPPEGEKPSRYDELDSERFGEHWVCDGESIFEFDYGQKLLKQIVLPPEAQGEAISKGPLPFLFRAKKDEIKERFWIRVITPEGKTGEYWLEAYPRTQEDAAHFKFVHIIIDQKEFLPKALILFKRSFTERSPARETFAFEERQVNLTWKNFLQGLQVWKRDFFAPAVPDGWKKVVQHVEAGPPADAGNSSDVPPRGPVQSRPDSERPNQAAQPSGGRTTRGPAPTRR